MLAVPVLPATSVPGAAAAPPVPAADHARRIRRGPWLGHPARDDVPAAAALGAHDPRAHRTPWLAIVAPTEAIWTAVARSRSLPDRGRPDRQIVAQVAR